MTRRRFIADEVQGDRAALTGEGAAHLARVLRARPGQEFDVVAGDQVRRGRVVSVDDHRVELELGEEVPAVSLPDVILLLAIFRFDRMEWAIEKLTELGVTRIVPVRAERTDVRLAASAEKRMERWRRIARQATQQARRASAPEIADPESFAGGLALPAQTRIVLAETEHAYSLQQATQKLNDGSVALAVGPEGGWTAKELDRFTAAGWTPANLGVTVLRAETAAIAATAVVMARIGE